MLGVRSVSGLAFYDWETTELIRRIEITPKNVSVRCLVSLEVFKSWGKWLPIFKAFNHFSPAADSESGTTEQFCLPATDSGTETRFISLVLEVVKLCILMKEGS